MRLRRPDWTRTTSLRTRLTLWNTAVVLAMTVATLVATRFAARSTLYADADAELRASVAEIVYAIQDLFPDIDGVVTVIRRKARSNEDRGWFVQLLTEDGVTIWKSDHCPAEVANFPPSRLDREENVVQVGRSRYVRLRVAKPDLPAYHVRIGTYTTGLDDRLAGLMRELLVVGAVISLLTPLAGWWLARRATRPVAAILQIAENLRPSQLGERLPVQGSRDELDRLARTINRLLDKVADHVDRQQRFVADAAHELRGPLAAMSSLVEVAVSHDRRPEEYRETLEEVLEETRHLAGLTNALLTLAEAADAEPVAPGDAVDLSTVVRQTAGMFAGVAEERGLDLAVAADRVVVPGNASQLRQVSGNLLDNAIRFTPSGGTVRVRVKADAGRGRAILSVSDTGRGIAPEHVARVFDRFSKADPARPREGGRSGGLGLAICKAIVERHGGTIAVASQPGRGTTVTVDLPLAAVAGELPMSATPRATATV